MKHEKYKELIELNIWGELSGEEEVQLQNHLFECDECNKEYSDLKKVYSLLTTERPAEPSDLDLINARVRLFNTINSGSKEKKTLTFGEKLLSGFSTKRYSVAFGSVILVSMGLLLGYILFSSNNNFNKEYLVHGIDLDKILSGEAEIASVNFPKKYDDEKIFEFNIDGEKPISYKGNMNDILVQELLAATLEKTENIGYKIKTVNIIKDLVKSNFIPDNKIKEAFINTLKNDENPGVRKSALSALLNFQFDNEIRDALVYTLNHDDNVSNRMDAISGLLNMKFEINPISDSSKIILEGLLKKENNEVIKFKTAKYLLGGK